MPKEGHTGARLASSGLQLVFEWTEDRFTHRVGDSLSSVAKSDSETPVYQEVHQQGELVFASGMSGDRHWSASIEPAGDGFLFDVACRAKTPADDVAVVYRGGESLRLQAEIGSARAEGDRLVVAFGPPEGEPPYTLRCRYTIGASK